MYAVIKTGGKQQKVQPGDVIQVELIDAKPGDQVTFDPILVVDDDGKTHFGKDAAKAVVTATVAGEKKSDKVRVFKYRPKSGYSRRQGHRQVMTVLEIDGVDLGKRPAAKKTERPAAKKAEKAAEAE